MNVHPETSQDTPEFTLGRGGLKIPHYEWRAQYDTAEHDFFGFFSTLLEINGFDTSTSSSGHNAGNYRAVPRAFDHSLVVPAEGDKPLVLIRGSFDPRPADQVKQDLARSNAAQEFGQWDPVSSGTEKYGLYIPPQAAGEWEPLLQATFNHTEGGSLSSHFSDFTIVRLDEAIRERNFGEQSPSSAEDRQQQREAHSQYLQTLLSDTIEFLS